MRILLSRLVVGHLLSISLLSASDALVQPRSVLAQQVVTVSPNPLTYYWKAAPLGDTAQMLTLFCRACGPPTVSQTTDLPLVSVLRDSLGDLDPLNDRILYVWLLRYARPTIEQRVFSSVPFFYWKVGGRSQRSISTRDVSPLLDLTSPQHPVLENLARSLVQWTAFDPATMPVRAISRSYRSNSSENERLHIEEALTYLRGAPASDSPGDISPAQLKTVIARLELRKQPLGGLVIQTSIPSFQEQVESAQDRIRARNWELLRQCAEKAGLYFEPLEIGNTKGQYAMLWYSIGSSPPQNGVEIRSIWKLLNIRDPRKQERLAPWKGDVFTRSVDRDGSLQPFDRQGDHDLRLIPIGVYNLSYPRGPLLLIDFNDKLHIRRHEMLQRSVNEITAGVIGISHFGNWYYFVAADIYNFVVSRHGKATDQNARLDCYAQLRADLFHDRLLDADLRNDLQKRLNIRAINPMEDSPEREMSTAEARYSALMRESDEPNGPLVTRLDRNRRAELATYSESPGAQMQQSLLHMASLGFYTRRAPSDDRNLLTLDRYRRAQAQIDFLDSLVKAGVQPEVSYRSDRIQAFVADLARLLPDISSTQLRAHASATLASLRTLSKDAGVQSDCTLALASMDRTSERRRYLAREHGD